MSDFLITDFEEAAFIYFYWFDFMEWAKKTEAINASANIILQPSLIEWELMLMIVLHRS